MPVLYVIQGLKCIRRDYLYKNIKESLGKVGSGSFRRLSTGPMDLYRIDITGEIVYSILNVTEEDVIKLQNEGKIVNGDSCSDKASIR